MECYLSVRRSWKVQFSENTFENNDWNYYNQNPETNLKHCICQWVKSTEFNIIWNNLTKWKWIVIMKKKHTVTRMVTIEFIAVFAKNFALDRYYSNHLKWKTHITIFRKRKQLNITKNSTSHSKLCYCIQLQTYALNF